MESIRESALNNEMQLLKTISEDRTLKVKEKYGKVEELGYSLKELGSGGSAYICAHQVETLYIHSRKYLNGNYLVYGAPNMRYGRGVLYTGYVKLIVPEEEYHETEGNRQS